MEPKREVPRDVLRRALSVPGALGTLLLSVLAFSHPGVPAPRALEPSPHRNLGSLEVRAAVLSGGVGRLEEFYAERVAPVDRILQAYHSDTVFTRRVSIALVSEGDQGGVDPRVLASVLLVENAQLDSAAVSFMGAVGLMQVMPFHQGKWECGPGDLTNVRVNICHGARIFAAYLREQGGDTDRALLAYNGCVLGTNTPACHLYPWHVYSQAGRMAVGMWLGLD